MLACLEGRAVAGPHIALSSWVDYFLKNLGRLRSWLQVLLPPEVGLPRPGLIPMFLLTESHTRAPWDPEPHSQRQHAEQ